MSDLIDRQSAIDALRGYLVGKRCPDDGTLTCRLIENEVINKLPPIQPDNNSEVPNSSDCISRQNALEAFGLSEKTRKYGGDHSGYATMMMYEIQDTIENLPPIQPKKGRWIGKYPVTSVCSECGLLIHDSKVKAFAYCPNCGADMRQREE